MLRTLYDMWFVVSEALEKLWSLFQSSPLDLVFDWLIDIPVIWFTAYTKFGGPEGYYEHLSILFPDIPLYLCLIGGGGAIFVILKLVIWLKSAIDW